MTWPQATSNQSAWNQRFHEWREQIESSQPLRRAWSLGLSWAVLGICLLLVRATGGLVAEPDLVRGYGFFLFMLGAGLISSGLVIRWTSTGTTEQQHQLSASITTIAGLLMSCVALLPGVGPLSAIVSILLIAGVILLAGQSLLSPMVAVQSARQDNSADDEDAREAWQQLTRTRQSDGTEVIEGMLRVEFAAGQKQAAAHVALTPSMDSLPDIECEPLNGEGIEASVDAVYPHGFRVEVRRVGTADSSETVDIGFQGSASRASDHAA